MASAIMTHRRASDNRSIGTWVACASGQGQRLRVCYFGTYRTDFPRNRILIEGLRQHGIEVIECHEQLWRGIDDRVQLVSGGWIHPGFWWRVLRTYGRLLRRYWRIGRNYDVLIVGYPGQFDVFLARLLSWLHRKPLVWDICMSIYLVALERGLADRSRTTVNLIRLAERVACRLPQLLILDTPEYVAWFQATHGVPIDRFRLVPLGADARVFRPALQERARDKPLRVMYFGTFVSNHGVEYIVEAARLLAGDDTIHFELIGQGPSREKAIALARLHRLSNLTLPGWLDPEELAQRVASADVCLGSFGITPHSLMTIQNKVYEGLAMGKPVLTGDGPAIGNVFTHGEDIYLCERANPQALAEALCFLRDNPELCRSLSMNGYARFQQDFSAERLGAQFKQYLLECLKSGQCH